MLIFSKRFWLAVLWAALLPMGLSGLWYQLSYESYWMLEAAAVMPLGFWGIWTYLLLTEEK